MPARWASLAKGMSATTSKSAARAPRVVQRERIGKGLESNLGLEEKSRRFVVAWGLDYASVRA